MKQHFYITTPIFYPTGVPHIGTAYNVFIADTLARYYRNKLGEKNVFFLTGTDEHGANIARKAEEAGKSPKEYVDEYAAIYQKTWENIGLSNDYFIRTTDPRHEQFAQELIQKSFDAGDIYEGEYSGLYCESCEAYYTEADLVDGKCPNHPTKVPVFTKEKNYYFKLSKYAPWLLELYESQPDFVRPTKWASYVKGLVEAGLQDIPVTRANVKWGVPVPFDSEQTIYVWYDALPNYLSTLNFPEFAGYPEKFWPNVTHVVGKDIIKFHAILWPAMLKSAGYEPPEHVLVHGFFTVGGLKIGKSNNNAIDPSELAAKYSIDAVRYALLTEFQIGNDGDFDEKRLVDKYNSELANVYGNLLSRVVHLAQKSTETPNPHHASDSFKLIVNGYRDQIDEFYAAYDVSQALGHAYKLSALGNEYIDERKPWKETDPQKFTETINNLLYLLTVATDAYAPALPEKALLAKESLASLKPTVLFPKIVDEK